MSTVISTRGLQKRFGRTIALDGLDLTVDAGEVHGFLGPNGAGKTTTLRILLGLARASGGEATLFGRDPWTEAADLHRRIAYVPGDVSIWPNFTGGEAIDLLSRLRGGTTDKAAYRATQGPALRGVPVRSAQEGALVLEGQPAEGRAHRRVRDAGRAVPVRRADQRPRPAHGADVQPGGRPDRRRRLDRAAVQPHPLRGRGALRPRQHHPRREDGRERHPRRTPPPHPHRDRVRARSGEGGGGHRDPRHPRPRHRQRPGAVHGRQRPRGRHAARARTPRRRRA